jgi:hypothetical protein
MADDVSLDRAGGELNARRRDGAAQASLDAVVCQLRTHGVAALKHPGCRGRLTDLSDGQLHEMIAALIRVRASYAAAITDELLIALDEIRCPA